MLQHFGSSVVQSVCIAMEGVNILSGSGGGAKAPPQESYIVPSLFPIRHGFGGFGLGAHIE